MALDFAPTETLDINGLKVAVWVPKAEPKAGVPLVIFSHGYAGCSLQSTFLTGALAAAGYLVAAPNHGDASKNCPPTKAELLEAIPRLLQDFGHPSSWNDGKFDDRRDDVRAVLDALRAGVGGLPKIDWSKVGLAGHSLGGYTVLGLGGGWPTWKTEGIGAILAMSPYCQPLAFNGKLDEIDIPVMFQGGTVDDLKTFLNNPRSCFDLAHTASFVEFEGADHLAWSDLSDAARASITAVSVGFFDRTLRGLKAELPPKGGEIADVRTN